jgi:CBS domain-containing protein
MCLALLGCVVPHGLLDPTMAIGAAFGRALGIAAEAAAGIQLTHGVFGLVGASAFVAGTSHTTIAFTMIIIEVRGHPPTVSLRGPPTTHLTARSSSRPSPARPRTGTPGHRMHALTPGPTRPAPSTAVRCSRRARTPFAQLVNDTSFLVPCVIAALIARAVSSHFGSGSYYETLLELHGHPFLEQADEERPELNLLTAADVMAKNPITLHATERLSSLVNLCSLSKHHGFPIVDGGRAPRYNSALVTEHGQGEDDDESTLPVGAAARHLSIRDRGAPQPADSDAHFIGFVTYERIVELLRRTFETSVGDDSVSASKLSSWSFTFEQAQAARSRKLSTVAITECADSTSTQSVVDARLPGRKLDVARKLESLELASKLLQLGIIADPSRVKAHADDWIDLRAESDIVPHVIGEGAPIRTLLQSFIRLGARHVTVTDRARHVVGIVTRADVMPEVLHHVLDGLTIEIRAARANTGINTEGSGRGGLTVDAKRRVLDIIGRARKTSTGSSLSSASQQHHRDRQHGASEPRDRASTWGGRDIVREMMTPNGRTPQDTPSNAGVYNLRV